MNRKWFLSVLLFLYATSGIAAFVLYNSHSVVPTASAPEPVYAYLAPREAAPDTEDMSEAAETAVIPESASETETSFTEASESETPFTEAVSEASESEAPEPEYTYTAINQKGRLFVRSAPSTDAEILTFMWWGATGDVLSVGDEWVLLRYKDVEGYTFKQYLKLTPKTVE